MSQGSKCSTRLLIPQIPTPAPAPIHLLTGLGGRGPGCGRWLRCLHPRRTEFCPCCEWCPLEIQTLDKSSSLAWMLTWRDSSLPYMQGPLCLLSYAKNRAPVLGSFQIRTTHIPVHTSLRGFQLWRVHSAFSNTRIQVTPKEGLRDLR